MHANEPLRGPLASWFLCCAMGLLLPTALAQQPARIQPTQPMGAPSVRELIDVVKTQKELAIERAAGLSGRSQIGPAHNASTPAAVEMPSAPLVWSVSGLNHRLTAVLVIDRKVHVVSNEALPVVVGGWRVRQISEQEVVISRGGYPLRLPVPNSATSAYPFVHALSEQDIEQVSAAGAMMSGAFDQLTPAQALATRLPTIPPRGGKR